MLIPSSRLRRPLTRSRFALALATGAGAALASLCAYLGMGPFQPRNADELAGVAVGILAVLAAHTRAYGIRKG